MNTKVRKKFQPDKIYQVTDHKGVEQTIYVKKVGDTTYHRGSLRDLEEAVRDHKTDFECYKETAQKYYNGFGLTEEELYERYMNLKQKAMDSLTYKD